MTASDLLSPEAAVAFFAAALGAGAFIGGVAAVLSSLARR